MKETTLSTVKVCKKIGIPRSTLYYLRESGDISFPEKTSNQHLWTVADIEKLQRSLTKGIKPLIVKSSYKTTNINNRRYLGNKYKLLPFITKVVEKNCPDIVSVADIFAGTGAVSSAFTNKRLITNDIMYSNYICHLAWFGTEIVDIDKIQKYIVFYNQANPTRDNYMSLNFANTYFNKAVCRKIGFIRENIEQEYKKRKINQRERAVLITSLLYGMDKIANTCGHYDAYRKNGDLSSALELSVPTVSNNLNVANQCYHIDANELVKNIKVDLVYIDPPYNSRQYCDIYHLLENVALWEKPKVFGVAKKMDRDNLKSRYCTAQAAKAFEELINNIQAKYILLSYNNMADKGNARSNARISDKDIMRILSKKGTVSVFTQKHKAFSAGKSNIEGNEERLFLCVCDSQPRHSLISSPLNYIGGKYKLLSQILPLFPQQIDTFVDLFCGGCNVGINVNAKKVILNDKEQALLSLYNTFNNLDKEEIFRFIDKIIDKYDLSRSSLYGYEKYVTNSSDGLGTYNKDKFLKMRDDFNYHTPQDYYYYVLLYVLIVYSFNNQIRFNKDGKFNLPVGKRDFNLKMRRKLEAFVDKLQKGNYEFKKQDFREFDIKKLNKRSFVYCDPPYLITCATYNEQKKWTEDDEKDLLAFLDKLNKHGVKFALSNVLAHKGRQNTLLKEWAKKYTTHYLNFNYQNANYQSKDKVQDTQEVLITNY